jgi:hypothetical protein
MKANTPDSIIAQLVRQNNGCWEWHGKKIGNGYGQVSLRCKPTLVHRLVYEHLVGPIPKGHDLHHKCGNPCCAEPTHLEPLSRRQHSLTGNTIIARAAAKTHCPRGHPLEGTNLRADEHRKCRACHNAANRRYYQRRKRVAEIGTAARGSGVRRSAPVPPQ